MEGNEQEKSKLMKQLCGGAVLTVIGVVLFMYVGPSLTADNLAIMKAAHSAQEAADAISSNNMKEIVVDVIGAACICVGLCTMLAGLVKPKKNK